jgi:hypothetical protein
MSLISTYTGRSISLYHPRPEDVEFIDIAHALSMQCRYNGHCGRFYSVAEHCCLLAQYFMERGETDNARWALIHDAAEAYTGDVIRPIKLTTDLLAKAERGLLAVIAAKLDLEGDEPEEVRLADRRILLDEGYSLFPDGVADSWGLGLTPLGVQIGRLSQREARLLYLDLLAELFPDTMKES